VKAIAIRTALTRVLGARETPLGKRALEDIDLVRRERHAGGDDKLLLALRVVEWRGKNRTLTRNLVSYREIKLGAK
jgi:hypothetical protein